jgi:hypothetical protein
MPPFSLAFFLWLAFSHAIVAVPSHSIVLYLANIASEASNVELHRSLDALQTVFLSRHGPYPVIVAYDAKDRRFLTPELQRLLSQTVTHLRFEPIRGFRRFPWPFNMYTDIYHDSNPYYTRVGYRHMCRYWAKTVFRQPFMQNVTSYMRLDTDTHLVTMPVNPFDLLTNHNLTYLASVVYKESKPMTAGLWETFLRFAVDEAIHPWGLTPLANAGVEDEDDLRQRSVREAAEVLYRRGYNLDYFYNNWEVSRVDLWTSSVYRRLVAYLDAAGGIVLRRWGDAPIRTLSLFLLRPAFRQYRGLRVYHKAYHQTSYQEDAPSSFA